MNTCYVCKKENKTVKHHLSYCPQIIINVCHGCHNKIHRGDLLEYKPTNRRMQLIFYAKKGHLQFGNNKERKRIPIKDYDYSNDKGFVWTNSRKLTPREKELRKEMRKSKEVLQ